MRDPESFSSDERALGEAHWLLRHRPLFACFFPAFSQHLVIPWTTVKLAIPQSPAAILCRSTIPWLPLLWLSRFEVGISWQVVHTPLHVASQRWQEGLVFILLAQLLLFIDVGQKFSTTLRVKCQIVTLRFLTVANYSYGIAMK